MADANAQDAQDIEEHPIREVARDYEAVHTGLGIAGNLFFFVGSVLFLFEPVKIAGVWLFILGSLGMLVGSAGSALMRRRGR
jgi:1,4-dihydroxy-2-naphthoate octaprenyltransferase